MKELLLFWPQTVNNRCWEGGEVREGESKVGWKSIEMDVQEEKSWGGKRREVGAGQNNV